MMMKRRLALVVVAVTVAALSAQNALPPYAPFASRPAPPVASASADPTRFLVHLDRKSRKDVVSGKNGNGLSSGAGAAGASPAKYGAGALGAAGPSYYETDLSSIGAGPFTIEGWARPTSASQGGLFSIGADTFVGSALVRMLNTRAVRVIFYHRLTGVSQTLVFTPLLALNTYTHVAVVRTGNSVDVAYDGVFTGSPQAISDPTNNGIFYANNFVVGGEASSATPVAFPGQMDDVRVSAAAIYTANFTPPSSAAADPTGAVADTVLASTTKFLSLFATIPSTYNGSDEGGHDALAGNSSTLAPGPFSSTYAVVPATRGPWWRLASDLNLGTGDFTVEAWIYPTDIVSAVDGIQDIIGTQDDVSTNFFNLFFVPGINEYRFVNGPVGVVLQAVLVPSLNTWHHIQVTRSGTSFALGFDGVRIATATHAAAIGFSSANFLAVASHAGPGLSRKFFGRVGYPRITAGAALYPGATYTVPAAPFSS